MNKVKQFLYGLFGNAVWPKKEVKLVTEEQPSVVVNEFAPLDRKKSRKKKSKKK